MSGFGGEGYGTGSYGLGTTSSVTPGVVSLLSMSFVDYKTVDLLFDQPVTPSLADINISGAGGAVSIISYVSPVSVRVSVSGSYYGELVTAVVSGVSGAASAFGHGHAASMSASLSGADEVDLLLSEDFSGSDLSLLSNYGLNLSLPHLAEFTGVISSTTLEVTLSTTDLSKPIIPYDVVAGRIETYSGSVNGLAPLTLNNSLSYRATFQSPEDGFYSISNGSFNITFEVLGNTVVYGGVSYSRDTDLVVLYNSGPDSVTIGNSTVPYVSVSSGILPVTSDNHVITPGAIGVTILQTTLISSRGDSAFDLIAPFDGISDTTNYLSEIRLDHGPLVRGYGDGTPATPSDVSVYLNGEEIGVYSVNPYDSRITLITPIPKVDPLSSDELVVEYSWMPWISLPFHLGTPGCVLTKMDRPHARGLYTARFNDSPSLAWPSGRAGIHTDNARFLFTTQLGFGFQTKRAGMEGRSWIRYDGGTDLIGSNSLGSMDLGSSSLVSSTEPLHDFIPETVELKTWGNKIYLSRNGKFAAWIYKVELDGERVDYTFDEDGQVITLDYLELTGRHNVTVTFAQARVASPDYLRNTGELEEILAHGSTCNPQDNILYEERVPRYDEEVPLDLGRDDQVDLQLDQVADSQAYGKERSHIGGVLNLTSLNDKDVLNYGTTLPVGHPTEVIDIVIIDTATNSVVQIGLV
jgi:hypothetical protein